ncbi:hypothetical protein DESC_740184 [Desulfosarcina cetonica]|nr:hypothetical protein DESC_740184 [Desulfosarcina cetonica]
MHGAGMSMVGFRYAVLCGSATTARSGIVHKIESFVVLIIQSHRQAAGKNRIGGTSPTGNMRGQGNSTGGK